MLISPRGPQPGTPWGGCLAGIALLITVTGCQQRDATAAKQPPAPPPPAVIVAEIQQRSVQVSAEFVAQTQGVPTVLWSRSRRFRSRTWTPPSLVSRRPEPGFRRLKPGSRTPS